MISFHRRGWHSEMFLCWQVFLRTFLLGRFDWMAVFIRRSFFNIFKKISCGLWVYQTTFVYALPTYRVFLKVSLIVYSHLNWNLAWLKLFFTILFSFQFLFLLISLFRSQFQIVHCILLWTGFQLIFLNFVWACFRIFFPVLLWTWYFQIIFWATFHFFVLAFLHACFRFIFITGIWSWVSLICPFLFGATFL